MKNRILDTRAFDSDLSVLLLRLIFGGLFVFHGLTKLLSFNKFLPMFQDYIGIGPKLSFILVIFAEFGCGLLIVLGLFTRLAVIPIFITMIVVFFIVHGKDPFVMKLLPFVYLLLCFVIFVNGSGRYSVDYLIFRRKS